MVYDGEVGLVAKSIGIDGIIGNQHLGVVQNKLPTRSNLGTMDGPAGVVLVPLANRAQDTFLGQDQ